MIPLPEWAPNVHPLLVHFPIALLAVAALFDLLSVFARERGGFKVSAVLLYTLGAVSLVASYVTGKDAADALNLPASIIPHVTDHADWAAITLWFFGVYAAVRVLVLWFDTRGKSWARSHIRILLFLVGAGGYSLVVLTSGHGSKLVYAYGAGVRHDMHETAAGPGGAEPIAVPGELVRVQVRENGSWHLAPGAGAGRLAEEDWTFLQGSLADLPVEAADPDSALAMALERGPILFTAGGPIGSVQAKATLNLSGFEGTVRLVHHVRDSLHYDFLEVADGRLRQGRLQAGEVTVFDAKPLDIAGWIDLEAVSDGTHFRGYANGDMLTHGHGRAPEAGAVGLYFAGSGTVLLRGLAAESLR